MLLWNTVLSCVIYNSSFTRFFAPRKQFSHPASLLQIVAKHFHNNAEDIVQGSLYSGPKWDRLIEFYPQPLLEFIALYGSLLLAPVWLVDLGHIDRQFKPLTFGRGIELQIIFSHYFLADYYVLFCPKNYIHYMKICPSNCPFEIFIDHIIKSKCDVLNFGGWYASRVAPENYKTYGGGISSIGLTIFE